MAQTVSTLAIPAGHQVIFFEKPRVLRRIFMSVRALVDDTAWAMSKLSFGDPLFVSYLVLAGPAKYFEAKGEGIFQGDVWVRNLASVDLLYTGTEILI